MHPFLALGRALQAAGFQAEVATSAEYRAKVEAEGLVFHEVGPSLERLRADLGMDLAQLTHAIAASDAFLFEKIMTPYLESATRQLIAAAQGACALVGGSFAAGVAVTADYLGIPFVSVALQPTVVFSAYDPPLLPKAPWLGPATGGLRLWLNRATIAIGRATTDHWTRPVNGLRRALGLPPSRDNLLFDAGRGAALSLGLYSPLLSPRQPDAPENFDVVGYAAYDSDLGGPTTLPPDLETFLAAGPAPLVFTLGSAAVNIPGDFYRESMKVARRMGRRAVLLVGPDGDPSVADGAEDAVAFAYAPYSLLFPRAAAIVHQGGVGTIQQALRAGRPQLVVPHLGDQFDNGARIARLGVGATLARDAYRSKAAAALIDRLLGDPDLIARTVRLGEIASREDGAAEAASRVAALWAARSGSEHETIV
ncbi:MAG: glycosyltransferase family 1 protein [Gemmatimonadaceae bacterium]|nr:glycosyltransferase family 1 protein [Caulobacter sp.]